MADGPKDISRRRKPADRLTEDLLIEILSRVPYRSLCRFKCVSKRWRSIISLPDHRKVLPQYHLHELAGFLYSRHHPVMGYLLARNFAHVSAGGCPPIRPSLPFLPDCDRFNLLDSCNGLLLCRRFETADSWAFDYVVCNPATEKWVVLPGYFSKMQPARLGFDLDEFQVQLHELQWQGRLDPRQAGHPTAHQESQRDYALQFAQMCLCNHCSLDYALQFVSAL